MKSQALGESTWTQYGNGKKKKWKVTCVFGHVMAYSEVPNQLLFIHLRI